MSWEFLVTTLVLVASPGTGAIYTLAASLSGGTRAGIVAAFGCSLGIIPHMIAAISGAATLFHTFDGALQVLKFAGVAYLLFMAWSMLQAKGAMGVDQNGPMSSVEELVSKAILVNLLNPKLSIFFLAFLPQFVRINEPSPIALMLLLSVVFMAVTFVVFSTYSVLASTLRPHVLTNPNVQRRMRQSFAGVFGLLALQLAFANR